MFETLQIVKTTTNRPGRLKVFQKFVETQEQRRLRTQIFPAPNQYKFTTLEKTPPFSNGHVSIFPNSLKKTLSSDSANFECIFYNLHCIPKKLLSLLQENLSNTV